MTTSIDVVIPVFNEEKALPSSIAELHGFLSRNISDLEWHIVIADNGSTDGTLEVAKRLSDRYQEVNYLGLQQRGRGRALRATWLNSSADILSYMDVDLSTDLEALPRLIDAITNEGYDLAIGSRLRKGSQVIGRSPLREMISRGYSLLFRAMFFTGFRDAQCGFKAVSRKAAGALVPQVMDTGWFFDSEMLILAEKNGYRIKEVPVIWTDDPESRVRIMSTAYGDLKGLLRLRFGGLRRASHALAEGDRSDRDNF